MTKGCWNSNVFHLRFIFMLLLIFMMFYPIKSIANETALSQVPLVNTPLSLATGTRYSPYIDERLPNGGWSTAVISAVFQQLKIDYIVETLPWPRVLLNTQVKLADGAFPFVETTTRQQDFYYSQPINFVPVEIISHEKVLASNIQGLKDYTLCLPYGYTSTPELLKVISINNTTPAPSTRDCLDKVSNGWADIVLVNRYNEMLNEQKYKKLKRLDIAMRQEPLYFIVAKKHPKAEALIELFNQGLSVIKQNNVLDEINKQYELLLKTESR